MYTNIQAINFLLQGASLDPVESEDFPDSDVEMAKQTLLMTRHHILGRGWWFNIEYGLKLNPDNQGQIKIPNDFLSFDSSVRSDRFTKRRGLLYDLNRHTFDFTDYNRCGDDTVSLDVKFDVDFTDLPVAAQWAIITDARMRFAVDLDLDQAKWQFNSRDSEMARVRLEGIDLENADINNNNSPYMRNFNSSQSFFGGGFGSNSMGGGSDV